MNNDSQMVRVRASKTTLARCPKFVSVVGKCRCFGRREIFQNFLVLITSRLVDEKIFQVYLKKFLVHQKLFLLQLRCIHSHQRAGLAREKEVLAREKEVVARETTRSPPRKQGSTHLKKVFCSANRGVCSSRWMVFSRRGVVDST